MPEEDLWIAGGSLHLVSEFEMLLFFFFFALHPPWTADGGIIMNGSFVKKELLMTSQYKFT